MPKGTKIHVCCRKTECICECNHAGDQDRKLWCKPCLASDKESNKMGFPNYEGLTPKARFIRGVRGEL